MMSIFDKTYLYVHFFFTYQYGLDMYYFEDIDIEIVYRDITNTIEVRSNAVEESLKRRTNDVKFAVGMIVTHIDKYSFILDNHDGVIIGWHRGYDIEIQNKFKETIMFPYLHQWDDFCHICLRQQFSASGHQLYYIILAENDIVCYVQQDQLSICPPKRINNIEIGRYFSSFKGTYYVPNESLRKHYPEDTAAIAKILAKQ
ncbi:F-box only protein 21-like isoform X2 [Formica exsecta]|uniref:F-box only protein 21-like isoform X2 n=1 Tax=Formica exsecta TaxID=72781 RepID=UPI0011416D26|nr:F-box only protein 21-like isoform X2 [Formica exsecta]